MSGDTWTAISRPSNVTSRPLLTPVNARSTGLLSASHRSPETTSGRRRPLNEEESASPLVKTIRRSASTITTAACGAPASIPRP